MKKKSKQVTEFIEKLNYHITSNPQFRKDTSRKSEQFIQAEIRPLIISFLEKVCSKGSKVFFREPKQ